MRLRAFCIAAALVCATELVAAQAPSFSVRSNLVSVPVIVTDLRGQPVRDLAASRFTVFEDGQRRPVAAFAHERVPLSLVVALDASLSMSGGRLRLAAEAVRALGGHARSDDQLALTAFNATAFLVAPWTSSPSAVVSAVPSVGAAGGTALYEGVNLALDVAGNAANPFAAVVVISDGHDSTRVEMRPMREARTVERIRRTDVAVFAIGLNVPAANAGDPAADFDAMSLSRLAEPSGGFARVVTSASALPAAARMIREQLDERYVLGFAPERATDQRFHRIRVEVAGCQCKVRARAGFMGGGQ
ncbi:MAG: VWA domain-containing protein [Vicinamibacterales bacterium]